MSADVVELERIASIEATLGGMEKRLNERFTALERFVAGEVKRLSEHIVANEQKVELALAAQQRAVDKAEQAVARRLDGMDAAGDQALEGAGRLITRKEVAIVVEQADLRLSSVTERLTRVEAFQAKALGAVGAVSFVATMLGIVSLVLTLNQ